jgi:hypothetical protein
MRTKALLLSAALVAAGVATSMAQTSNVYSLNIVGYINVPFQKGYNLLASQLDVDGVDNISTVLSNGVPDGAQYFTLTSTGFDPNSPTYDAGSGAWLDNSFNNATNVVKPGQAFLLFSPNISGTITLVGQVSSSTNTFPVLAGYGFYGEMAPAATDLVTAGFPSIDGAQFFTLNGNTYVQNGTYDVGSGAWLDNSFNTVFPTPAVGQGFLIFNPHAATTWTQKFVVQ